MIKRENSKFNGDAIRKNGEKKKTEEKHFLLFVLEGKIFW